MNVKAVVSHDKFTPWNFRKKLEIRSVEWGICPIATLH